MSTKTLRKRIALVAVSALGFGLMSAVPSSAAESFNFLKAYEVTTALVLDGADVDVDSAQTPSTVFSNTEGKYIRISPNSEMIANARSIRASLLVAPAAEVAATALPKALGTSAGVATTDGFLTGFTADGNILTAANDGTNVGLAAATADSDLYLYLAEADFNTAGTYTIRVYADADSSGTFSTGEVSENISFTVGAAATADAVSLSKTSVIGGDVVTITVSSNDGTYSSIPSTDLVTLADQFSSCSLGTRNSATSITLVRDYLAGVSRAICTIGTAGGLVATGLATTAALGAGTLTFRTGVSTAAKVLSVASTNTAGISYSGLYGPITTASIAADSLRTSTITVDTAVTAVSFQVTNNADQAGNYNVWEVSSSNTASVSNTAKTIARIGVDGLSTAFSVTNAAPVAGDSYVVKVYGNGDVSTTAWATYTIVYSKAKPKLSIKSPTDNPKVVVGGSQSFKVKTTDLFGRVLASQPVTMTVAGRNTIASTLSSDATGYVTFSYTDAGTTAAATSDTVTFTATNAAGSATAVSRTITYITTAIAVGSVSISNSETARTVDTVQSDAAFGYADATAVTTLKATVRKADGTVVGSGVLVTFTGGSNDLFVDDVNTAVTDSNGEATATVYRNVVGTSTFTATANGVTSAASTSTKWSNTAGTSARYVSVTADPATAVSQGVIRVTAKVTDRWGNPVDSVDLALSEDGAGRLMSGVAATGATTTTGTYSWDLSTLAGETGKNTVTVLVTEAGTQVEDLVNKVAGNTVTGAKAGNKSAQVEITFTKDTATSTADALLALAQALGTRDQASATVDAAAEATDAANAATDAANAAAEAADAATAAAQDASDAVATLSAQVSEAIAGLKKQLVSLTNLVIKIQKKVKA